MTRVLLTMLFLSCLGAIACVKETPVSEAIIPFVSGFAFSGPDIAWLVTSEGDLLRSEDAGQSWNKTPGRVVGGFEKISFIDARQGWALNKQGELWQTNNSGVTWVSIAKLYDQDYPPGGPLLEISFVDHLHGWVVDVSSIWRTEDGGISWRQYVLSQAPNKVNELIARCDFINPDLGWLYGQKGGVYLTKDGGKTWQAQSINMTSIEPLTIFFIDDHTGWGQGKSSIYRTDDGGKTWHLQQDLGDINLRMFYFVNETEGWAIGDRVKGGTTAGNKFESIVLRSTDSGRNWQFIELGENSFSCDYVYFADAQNGWIKCYENVYHTDDGGRTWQIVFKPQDKTEKKK